MSEQKVFKASEQARSKALKLRAFAFLAWLLAMGGQVFAILKLLNDEMMTWLIVAIVVILALAITGNLLWKKANKIDPASEKDKFKFFIQNQLGAFMGVLSFLPLVILIFTNKNMSGKTKGIAGTIGVIALLAAGVTGVDFNPASIEKYTEEINQQTEELKELNFDKDNVYWSIAGFKYHIKKSCYHIADSEQIFNGTVKEFWEDRSERCTLCKTCKKRALKENAEKLLE